MKLQKFLLAVLFSVGFLSCEDVVDVELKESAPRLVVEASLLWDVDKEENTQFIRLTTTAPFFEENIPPAIDATVSVMDDNGREYVFEEMADGIFRNDEIDPSLELEYTLIIEYEGETYTATEPLVPTPQLDFVTQDRGGFSGDDYEFKVYYTDPAEMQNYYLFRYVNDDVSLQIYDDEFTNGNRTFAFFNDEDASAGDIVAFEIQGISRGFYEYMFILRSQSGSSNGGPFQTQPGIVRGNIVNITNPDNFAFGYFRLSGTNMLPYVVQ